MTSTSNSLYKIRRDIRDHIAENHSVSPFSTYIKELVYGGNDGIITTFAVVAGFAGATGGSHIPTLSYTAVLLFGLANLFADAASMGLGEFLSMRSSIDLYRSEKAKELHEIRNNKEHEKEETVNLLRLRGFSDSDAKTLATIFASNEKYWLDFMMSEELELPDAEKENPVLTAAATFFSFIFFGTIPLIPYVFLNGIPDVFYYSIGATFVALVFVGVLRWKVTSQGAIRSIGETVLIGFVAAVIAYTIGTFFRA